jgi:hypothetical protein
VFRSHEADVLREIQAFIADLPGAIGAASEPDRCREGAGTQLTFMVDGAQVPCSSAMAVPRTRIAEVEVLKGAAAVSRYPGSGAGGVILIHTLQEP